jgi:hypothetical protein
MDDQIEALIEKIGLLNAELEAEFAKRQAQLRYGMERGRAIFEEEILRRHKELRTKTLRYIRDASPLVALTAPVIYSLIIPLVLLDLSVMIYQALCFPVYGLTKVRRTDYLIFDRHNLAYLNIIEKVNCGYCSYANGLIGFVREVAARTEQYWCPIKHARRVISNHAYYAEFTDYGDADAYRKRIEELSAKKGHTRPPGKEDDKSG